VYIPEDLYSQALVVAQMRGVSVSVVLREGLAKEVGRIKKSKKRGIFSNLVGALKNGPRDMSSRVNDIYR